MTTVSDENTVTYLHAWNDHCKEYQIHSSSLFVAVRVSFQRSTQTVREDSGSVQLQLQSRGLYGRNFNVSFRCIEVFPVEAKGTIIVLDCDHCRMCAC